MNNSGCTITWDLTKATRRNDVLNHFGPERLLISKHILFKAIFVGMEKNPWYKNVEGPFLQWKGPIGVKEDGGGCTRAQGRVGNMVIHRAAFNKNKDGTYIFQSIDAC